MKKLAPLVNFCRSLPHATEDIKWEKNLVFSVGNKMFAVFDADRLLQFSFKVTPENFARLTALDGVIPAPYLARHYWIAITEADALPQDMLRELLRESYEMVAAGLPAKARRQLGLDNEANEGKRSSKGKKKQS
jgi:predicted DNA-binding protein (MmcQ/YjbR family)